MNPRNGYTWTGNYWNNAGGARPESGDGQWVAEASGSGPEDDEGEEPDEDEDEGGSPGGDKA